MISDAGLAHQDLHILTGIYATLCSCFVSCECDTSIRYHYAIIKSVESHVTSSSSILQAAMIFTVISGKTTRCRSFWLLLLVSDPLFCSPDRTVQSELVRSPHGTGAVFIIAQTAHYCDRYSLSKIRQRRLLPLCTIIVVVAVFRKKSRREY